MISHPTTTGDNSPGLTLENFQAPVSEFGILRFSQENFPKVLKIADGLKKIGERHNATASQVALAWLLGQGSDIVPIPGTTKLKV